LETFKRQKLSKINSSGKKETNIPMNIFFGKIKPGIGAVSNNLKRESVEEALKQSYRRTEENIGKKLSKESIRKELITISKKFENIEKIRPRMEVIPEMKLKDAGDKGDNYKQAKGNIIQRILGKIFNIHALYIMADGVGIPVQGSEGKRECKVGVLLRQTQEKIEEIGTFCTWERINIFKNMLEMILLKIFSKLYPIIIISDGAKWIRNLRTKIACLKNTKWILDWFHLKDKCLKMLIKFELDEKSELAQKLIGFLWEGKIKRVLKEMKKLSFSELEEEKKTQDTVVEGFKTYLKNQKEGIINYKKYKEKGYMVGSGYIEKKNDILIKDRMVRQKRMRWGLEGGEAMMQILTAKMNGRLEELFSVAF